LIKVKFRVDEKIWKIFFNYCRKRGYKKTAVLRRIIKEWLRNELKLDSALREVMENEN